MEIKKILENQKAKKKISISLDERTRGEFVKLMKKHFPEASLSSFLNNVLIEGLEDLKKLDDLDKNVNRMIDEKLGASDFMKETIKQEDQTKA